MAITTVSYKGRDYRVPVVSAKGLSNQRQLAALASAPKYFSKDQLRSARVATGITLEYTLHGTSFTGGPDDKTPVLPEDRVVLIMGFLQAKESWAAVIDLLLEKYSKPQEDGKRKNVKILCFDNRGVGGSSTPWWRYRTSQMAQDTLALMDHVGWDAANVVGVSMGGMISLELASAAPQRVKSLSLIVTTRGKYKPDPRSSVPLRKSTFAKDPVEGVTNLLELLYPLETIRESHMDSGKSVYDALFAFHKEGRKVRVQPGIFGMIGQLLAIRTHFVSDERLIGIKNAGFPVLLIGSMKDILIPPIESIKLMDRMEADHVHTLFFETGGHGVTIQYVEEVSDGIISTLQRAKL